MKSFSQGIEVRERFSQNQKVTDPVQNSLRSVFFFSAGIFGTLRYLEVLNSSQSQCKATTLGKNYGQNLLLRIPIDAVRSGWTGYDERQNAEEISSCTNSSRGKIRQA